MIDVTETPPKLLPHTFTWYKFCRRCKTGDLYLDTSEGRTVQGAEIACYQCGDRIATDSPYGVELLLRMDDDLNSSERSPGYKRASFSK